MYDSTTKRAFASSFDRHIYEIDPETCHATGRVFSAPFKNRWLASLEREPETLLAQTRDGSLHKVNVDTGKARSVRVTPPAIWSAAPTPDGELVLGGEGTSLLRVRGTSVDDMSRIPYFESRKQTLDQPLEGHTKRLVVEPRSGNVVMGRTDGHVVVADSTSSAIVTNVGSAIRDLTLGPDGTAYVATERGTVEQVDLASGVSETVFVSNDGHPIWSIAYREQTQTLAALERFGSLHLIDTNSGDRNDLGVELTRCKRAKWVDGDLLMYSTAQNIRELDVRTGNTRDIGTWAGYTVEDFIWDPQRRWTIAISYLCKLYLFDYATARTVAVIRDQIDYSKGLCWLAPVIPETGYPLDFATFGRSGTMHLYRVHDDSMVALGPVGTAPTAIGL